MKSTEQIKEEGVKEYLSKKRTEAINTRWARTTDVKERREKIAVAKYKYLLLHRDKEQADLWMTETFGEEKGKELINSKPFKRQYISTL